MMNLIDKERLDAFYIAIKSLFKKSDIQKIILLEGGSQSKVYKIMIENKPLIVRLMDLNESLLLRQNQINCLQIAVHLGIAPKCYYANAESGVAVMEYIASKPIEVDQKWLNELAISLSLLHSHGAFPPPHQPLFSYIKELSNSIVAFSIGSSLKHYLSLIEQVISLLQPHLFLASSHNDLNNKNILFNGQKTFLIDWEAAGMEDPFFDLATICNELLENETLEHYFLQTYFNCNPSLEQLAKLFFMKQISHCYIGLHYLLHAVNGGLHLSDNQLLVDAPTMKVWKEGFNLGKYQLANSSDFLLYGMSQIKTSLMSLASEEFKRSKLLLTK